MKIRGIYYKQKGGTLDEDKIMQDYARISLPV